MSTNRRRRRFGRMIAPSAQLMLLSRPKFKFLRFQMLVNTYKHIVLASTCERTELPGWIIAT